jgi:proteasome alpha subunit
MIEEPYRWVEAISNRREYIEHQLAAGSPIAGLTFKDGILFLTLGRERQKIFEIYDRIVMGGIGHPGDIERLRMAAIEVASTEGFTRSARDVSLRRLATYSLSPPLKAAFEQVYGPPYLARMVFAELGRGKESNLFVRVDYDGSIHTNGGTFAQSFEEFGVVSGTKTSTHLMEEFLRSRDFAKAELRDALNIALDAWSVGHISLAEDAKEEIPDDETIARHRNEQLQSANVEAAILDRTSEMPITFRRISREDLEQLLS